MPIVYPVQTVVVYSTSDDGSDLLYWVLNALILCVGVGLNRLGSVLGGASARQPRGRRGRLDGKPVD